MMYERIVHPIAPIIEATFPQSIASDSLYHKNFPSRWSSVIFSIRPEIYLINKWVYSLFSNPLMISSAVLQVWRGYSTRLTQDSCRATVGGWSAHHDVCHRWRWVHSVLAKRVLLLSFELSWWCCSGRSVMPICQDLCHNSLDAGHHSPPQHHKGWYIGVPILIDPPWCWADTTIVIDTTIADRMLWHQESRVTMRIKTLPFP